MNFFKLFGFKRKLEVFNPVEVFFEFIIKQNIIKYKSFNFAVDIVNLHKKLAYDKKEYVMPRQLLKSGTSIRANVREAEFAQSKLDFINKI